MSSKPPLHSLTGLRFVAAMAVVFFHLRWPGFAASPSGLRNLATVGYIAVNVFFILSGFILTYVYIDNNGEQEFVRRDFWIARFARIYPVYLAGLVLAAPLFVVEMFNRYSAVVLVLNLVVVSFLVVTLMQSWLPNTAFMWNFPAWSLSVECFFYAIFPSLAAFTRRFRQHELLLGAGACWVLSLVPATIYFVVYGDGLVTTTDAEYLWLTAAKCLPLLRLPDFLIGIAIGRMFLHEIAGTHAAKASRHAQKALLSTLAGFAVLAALAMSDCMSYIHLHNGLLTPLFALLIYSLAFGNGPFARFLSLRPLILLGEASYAIYILHFPLLRWAVKVADVFFSVSEAQFQDSISCFLLYLATLIGLSILTYRYLEAPARGWLRRTLGKHWR